MKRCIKLKAISAQKILVTTDDEIIGINLGYDFEYEHEHGIKGLRETFKMNNFELGLSAYSIKKIDLNGQMLLKKIIINGTSYVLLLMIPNNINFLNNHDIDDNFLIHLHLYPHESVLGIEGEELYPGLFTSWDNNSFGILAEEKYEKYLNDLYSSFLEGDISLDVHSDNFFPTRGLTICINSRIPKDIKYEIRKKDESYLRLLCKMEKTGIVNILQTSGKEYYELMPKWKDEAECEIVFYLNPKEQNKYKTGWFTYEDLINWTKDNGSVLKEGSGI